MDGVPSAVIALLVIVLLAVIVLLVIVLLDRLRRREPPPRDPELLGKTIVVLSDTHGSHREIEVPDADILIHAGDFTRFGNEEDAVDFNEWLGSLPHKTKIVVEGNHEANAPWKARTGAILSNATFLRNEGTTAEGVTIWGKGFFWNMKSHNPYDDLIPAATDVLVAHNPARGFCDGGQGCEESAALCGRLRPRVYICGHIHHAKGVAQGTGRCASTVFVNGASVLGDHKAKKHEASAYTLNGKPEVIRI